MFLLRASLAGPGGPPNDLTGPESAVLSGRFPVAARCEPDMSHSEFFCPFYNIDSADSKPRAPQGRWVRGATVGTQMPCHGVG